MNVEEANDFITRYRDTLQKQYEANQAEIEQQKQNDMAKIMSTANKAGVMYSNFPERSKVQYESQTYLPSLQKNYSTYQTGLDKLRENVVNYQNNIKSLEKAIADLNGGTIISNSMY